MESLRRVRKENVVSRWPFSLYNDAAAALDRRVGWDKLPKPIAMLVLIGLRNILREQNLYDTGRGPLDQPDVSDHPRYLTARTLDGTFNDLDDPLMGSLGSRFGRNVPLERDRARAGPLLEPNPRLGQPRAADARRVHPGDDAEPARRRLDPVRGARLVQPRQERDREPVAGAARRRRPVARASDADPAHAARPERRTPTGRRRSSPTTRTGGTARRSTAATRRSPRRSAPASTASCASTTAG